MPPTAYHCVHEIAGVRVLLCAPQGVALARAADANDFIAAAWEQEAQLVAIPLSRLGADFFELRNRVAGEAIQKFVNYGLRLAFLGDIAAPAAASRALNDFVREANHGRSVWFAADLDALRQRLAD